MTAFQLLDANASSPLAVWHVSLFPSSHLFDEWWDQDVSLLSINDLNLHVRAWNALINSNLLLVADICARSPRELLKLKHVGEKSLKHLVCRLSERGLKLREA